MMWKAVGPLKVVPTRRFLGDWGSVFKREKYNFPGTPGLSQEWVVRVNLAPKSLSGFLFHDGIFYIHAFYHVVLSRAKFMLEPLNLQKLWAKHMPFLYKVSLPLLFCYTNRKQTNAFPFFFFFGSAKIWTQGFMLAKYALYGLNHTSSPFLKYGLAFWLGPWFSYFMLPTMAGMIGTYHHNQILVEMGIPWTLLL
jgi:hypothetical protein